MRRWRSQEVLWKNSFYEQRSLAITKRSEAKELGIGESWHHRPLTRTKTLVIYHEDLSRLKCEEWSSRESPDRSASELAGTSESERVCSVGNSRSLSDEQGSDVMFFTLFTSEHVLWYKLVDYLLGHDFLNPPHVFVRQYIYSLRIKY